MGGERSATRYVVLLVLTVVLGLATRRYPSAFPEFVATYAGDALWAMMVFWALGLVWRRATTTRLALIALGVSFGVEASQLLRVSWLDALRATRIGGLALGQGFLWGDLLCYAIGVLVAASIDVTMRRAKPLKEAR